MHISWIYLITLLAGTHSTESDHAIYISTFYVDISTTEVKAEVRVFEDDLRAALRSHTGYVTDTTVIDFQEDVLSYFRKYLLMDISTHPVIWQIQDLKLVGDSYRIYLQSELPISANDVDCSISAPYFFELFPTQKNVLRLRRGELQEHHIFEGDADSYQISL